MVFLPLFIFFFFFNDTATTEIYTLSLHDALPILRDAGGHRRDRSTGQSARDIAAAGARETTRRERARSRSGAVRDRRSEEHTPELQSLAYLVCRLLLYKKKNDVSKLCNLTVVRLP